MLENFKHYLIQVAMNDPNNPGRVYNTDERLKNADPRTPPPKPIRKPDPSLRQLQRQISIGQVGNSTKDILA